MKIISNVELTISIEFTFPHSVPFLSLFSFSSPRKYCSYHLCRAAAPKSIIVIDFTNDCTGAEYLKICNTVKEYIYLNWIREGERDSCKYRSHFYIITNLNEEIFRLFYAEYCKYILWLHIYTHIYAQVYFCYEKFQWFQRVLNCADYHRLNIRVYQAIFPIKILLLELSYLPDLGRELDIC